MIGCAARGHALAIWRCYAPLGGQTRSALAQQYNLNILLFHHTLYNLLIPEYDMMACIFGLQRCNFNTEINNIANHFV